MIPLIGILTGKKDIKGKLHSALYFDYVHSVHKAGGAPILLPLINDKAVINSIVKRLNGLLLPGGVDLHPKFFNQEVKPLNGKVNEEQDVFDLSVLEIAKQNNIPILAICRGHQVLNVAYEGTIHQDLSYDPNYDGTITHEQDKTELEYHLPIHSVEIDKDSILHTVCGSKLATNSFHHQSIDRLGKGLKCVARCTDGIVEAVESIDDSFVLGVQWHPEKMVDHDPKQLAIFERFIEACK